MEKIKCTNRPIDGEEGFKQWKCTRRKKQDWEPIETDELVRKTHGISKIQCARTDLSMEKKGSNNGNVLAGKYNSGDQKNLD